MVRIRRFHRRGRGSIPRMGVYFIGKEAIFYLFFGNVTNFPQIFSTLTQGKNDSGEGKILPFCMQQLTNNRNLSLKVSSIGGSVVECSPANGERGSSRAARVRFPADAALFLVFMKKASSKQVRDRWR